MLRRLYDWTIALASKPHALWALAIVSFTESSFFPIPPDALLIPMVLARPDRGWKIGLVCTVTSVIGGLFGYAIGYFLYETAGRWIIEFYGYENGYAAFKDAYDKWGLWIILIKGLTPIPYKLVTIASGAAQFDFTVFILASIATRGARFFIEVALLRVFGQPIRRFVEKYLTAVTTGLVLIVVGGFIVAGRLL